MHHVCLVWMLNTCIYTLVACTSVFVLLLSLYPHFHAHLYLRLYTFTTMRLLAKMLL